MSIPGLRIATRLLDAPDFAAGAAVSIVALDYDDGCLFAAPPIA